MYKNLTIRELQPQGAKKRTLSQSSLNNWMGSVFESNEKVNCRKVCFKRLYKKVPSEKSFDSPRRLLPGSVGSAFNMHMY